MIASPADSDRDHRDSHGHRDGQYPSYWQRNDRALVGSVTLLSCGFGPGLPLVESESTRRGPDTVTGGRKTNLSPGPAVTVALRLPVALRQIRTRAAVGLSRGSAAACSDLSQPGARHGPGTPGRGRRELGPGRAGPDGPGPECVPGRRSPAGRRETRNTESHGTPRRHSEPPNSKNPSCRCTDSEALLDSENTDNTAAA
jgi:hypothetical protein